MDIIRAQGPSHREACRPLSPSLKPLRVFVIGGEVPAAGPVVSSTRCGLCLIVWLSSDPANTSNVGHLKQTW